MSRFLIQWSAHRQRWLILDNEDMSIAADFDSLLEAETYVIERSERSER